MKKILLSLAMVLASAGAWAEGWSYSKTVTLGEKITDLSSITDGQTVAFKIVSKSAYITIDASNLDARMSATPTGLSVFKLHKNGDVANQFKIESAREGYYFPNITNTGWPDYIMTNEEQNVFEFLTNNSVGTSLPEGQFVIKSTKDSDGKTGYFDGNASDFTGWEGKGDNANYEIYNITPSEDKYVYGNYTYELTDANGNKYEGSFEGFPSALSLTGVPSSYIGEVTVDGTKLTAQINFPFPVSEVGGVTNPTMISSFSADNFKWYAVGEGIRAQKNTVATASNVSDFLWAVYTKFDNGAFKFNIKNIGTGKYIYSTSDQNNHDEGAVVLSETPSDFTIDATCQFKLSTGKYLSLNSSNNNTEQIIGTWASHGGTNSKIINPTFNITLAEDFATLYSPVSVSVPEGLTAYAVTSAINDYATLTEMSDIVAENGAILKGTAGNTYTFTLATTTTSDWTGNKLEGTLKDAQVDGPAYVLAKVGENVGLYSAELIDGKFKNNSGKAYLPASAIAASARFLLFDFGTETAIESIEGAENADAVVYDLAGRRVKGAQKGLYIVNGKVVIK